MTSYLFGTGHNRVRLQDQLKVMSASIVSRLIYFRDFVLAMVALGLGRLLPTLKPPPADLTGKVAVITGGNSGIGFAIALELARQGSTVYLACRNMSKADDAVSQIQSQVPESKGRIRSIVLDTSSLGSVRAFASIWETLNTKIDLLFHNAGIAAAPGGQEVSADDFPMVYATNLLGPFLLTYLLESHLSSTARVIMTSSVGQYGAAFSSNFSLNGVKTNFEIGFHLTKGTTDPEKAASTSDPYMQTKAMQVAFAKLLHSHFDRKAAEAGNKSRRVVHAFGPGFVSTPILDKFSTSSFFAEPLFWLFRFTVDVLALAPAQGAATGVWLASTKDETVVGEGMGGGYWDRMTRRLSSIDKMSKDNLERFWVRWEADAGVTWR